MVDEEYQQGHICSAAEDELVWTKADESLTSREWVQDVQRLQPYFMIVASALSWCRVVR